MKRAVLIGSLVVVVLVGFGIYYLASNINDLVAAAIEKHGSEATETTVSVSGVDIQIREGRGTIAGLRVESPEGFDTSVAFQLDDITLDMDVASVREDPIVIEELRVKAPVIHAEMKKTGSSNVNELRKRVQAHADRSSGGASDDGGGTEKKIRIQRLIFEEGRIEVDASALGVEKRTIALPAINLEDVGGASGVPPADIAKVVLTTVAKSTASEIASSEVQKLIDQHLDGESVTEKAKGLLDDVVN
jgi:hypothetical protein